MYLRKYHLTTLLDSCKKRGLTKIDQILEELNDFDDTDIVFTSEKSKPIAVAKSKRESNEDNKK